jgi:hypothetical protein
MIKKILIGLCILLAIPFASAAFSSPTLENNTAMVPINDQYEYRIVFQNEGVESKVMTLEVTSGNEWVEESTLEVTVPGETYDEVRYIILKAHEESEVGDVGTIEYTVSEMTQTGYGMVPLGGAIKKKFNIEVTPEIKIDTPQSDNIEGDSDNPINYKWIITGLLGAVCIVGCVFVWKKK